MKKAFLIISVLLSITLAGQDRYALLIGIGRYPDDSGWNLIHGDNDVKIIKGLLYEQGFKAENIATLTNENATKSEILIQLNILRERVHLGDVVYIHFSGHGQQVTDLNGDERDGYDESWIPYDAKKKYVVGVYEGENHIIDDEINAFLNGLRSKIGARGKIVVVADACHSGSGSRGLNEDDDFVRGTSEKFVIPHSGSNFVKKEEPIFWLYVGACKSYQTNHEYKSADGIFYGSLSYVIANGESELAASNYRDVILQWRNAMVEITRYPQDICDEGRPSRKSDKMF